MGIYYDHGVQYMVVSKKRNYVIVPLKEADQRLLQTDYYKTRKDSWFNEHGAFCKPITGGAIDISLTDEEKERLESILKTVDDVESYGWYDVQIIYDTYGI